MIVLPFCNYENYVGLTYEAMNLVIATEDVNFSIKMGAAVLLIHFLVSFGWKNERFRPDPYEATFGDMTFYLWCAFGFALIMGSMGLAWYFGTGRAGVEGTRLPFKLSGVINFFAYYFPTFYVIFITENFLKRGKSLMIPILLVCVLFGVQMIVVLSKSALIYGILLVLVYLLLSRKLDYRPMLGLACVMIGAFVMGSFVSSYRDSLRFDFKIVKVAELDAGYSAMSYVHRIFREGMLFQKFHAYSNISDLGESLEMANYNPSDLNTYIMDKTPTYAVHSSGCSTLVAFYSFGMPFAFLAAFVMSATTVFFDYKLPRLKGVFSSVFIRSYLVYFVVLSWFYLAFAQIIGVLAGNMAGLVVWCVIPAIVFVLFYGYVRLCCRKREIAPFSPDSPAGPQPPMGGRRPGPPRGAPVGGATARRAIPHRHFSPCRTM